MTIPRPIFHDSTLPIGSNFGLFHINALIGEGTFGSVYDATWVPYDRRVALKTLHRTVVANRSVVDRFMRETDAVSRLHHPHIVGVLDAGWIAETPYLAMEFVDGVTLDHWAVEHAPAAPERAVAMILPILSALTAVHDAGMVHRDLKPANVIVREGRHGPAPKLLDFGLVKLVDGEQHPSATQATVCLGTPNFMAPEQITRSKPVSPASDQYSAAVILFYLLTATKPFATSTVQETMQRVCEGVFRRPRECVSTIPEAIEAVVLKAMAVHPEDRFESVIAMGTALMPFASAETRALWAGSFGPAPELTPERSPGRVHAAGVPSSEARRIRAERAASDRRTDRAFLALWCALLVAGGAAARALPAPRSTPMRRVTAPAPPPSATSAPAIVVPEPVSQPAEQPAAPQRLPPAPATPRERAVPVAARPEIPAARPPSVTRRPAPPDRRPAPPDRRPAPSAPQAAPDPSSPIF